MRHHRLLLPLFLYILTSNLAYSLDSDHKKININKFVLAESDNNNKETGQNNNSSKAPSKNSGREKNLAWEFGINLDFNQLNDNLGGALGIQLGKDLLESKYFYYGVQTHIGFSSSREIKYNNDLNFERFSLYGIARIKQIPAIQFKAGITQAKYKTLSMEDSGTGFSYGAAIVTEITPRLRVHWIDYEIHDINNQSFSTISINLYIIMCALSGTC